MIWVRFPSRLQIQREKESENEGLQERANGQVALSLAVFTRMFYVRGEGGRILPARFIMSFTNPENVRAGAFAENRMRNSILRKHNPV